MQKITFPKTAVLLLSALSTVLLVGCSNSDNSRPSMGAVSNSVESPQDKPPVTQRVVQGNIVKGLVDSAQINVYEIRGNKVSGSPVGTAQSDSSGHFELSLPADGLAEQLYIEAVGASGATRMRCDAETCGTLDVLNGDDADGNGVIGAGEWVHLSNEFRLTSVIPDTGSAESLNVSLTPLAHFATQRAVELGDMSRSGIQAQMQGLASALNLPTTLSQMTAVDVTSVASNGESPSAEQRNAFEYGLHSAAVARYASVHNLTIEEAIADIGRGLYRDSGFNRELITEMLEHSLAEARRNAAGNPFMQQLITHLQLVINRHRCRFGEDLELDCPPIVPPPVDPPENDLDAVKALVGDFRGWVRELALQNETGLNNFESRMRSVGKVWEDDIKELGSALNDILPGVSRALSPAYDFCYYCEQDGVPFYGSGEEKVLNLNGLEYVLSSNGALTVTGSVRNANVDVRLQFPDPTELSESHGIEMTAGRVSKDNMDLVVSRGSYISATFADGVTFAELGYDANESGVPVPMPTDMSINLNFFVEAEYGISPEGLVDFEGSDVPAWLDTADWQVVDGMAQSGTYSLRSAPIGNNESSEISANIETLGGYLTFNYAIATEANYDFFTVYVDGDPVLSASGYEPEFKSAQVFLSPGEHNIVWKYEKDGEISHNQDAVWLDNIQFPALASDSAVETVSQNILDGQMTVTAHKLDQPWSSMSLGYLPGEISVNAVFSNNFLERSSLGNDTVSLNLAANIANAADFVPPVALDVYSLGQLGEYTVTDELFVYDVPGLEIHITSASEGWYWYEVFIDEDSEPVLSYMRPSEYTELHLVAGEFISNSGIGLDVVVPDEGLYLTTLVGASPWGEYTSSRFKADGGVIYGYLAVPYEPRESEDRYLEISVSFEIGVHADGLPEMTLGGYFDRESLRESRLEFYVLLDGHRFNFLADGWYDPRAYGEDRSTLDVNSPRFELINQDGVKLKLVFEDIEDVSNKKRLSELQGELVYNGEVYGVIKRVNGLTAIEYIDGSGETLE